MSDTSPPQYSSERFRPVAELIGALTFLTRLPIPFARTIDPATLTASLRMFAPAGAMIGGLLGLLLYMLHWVGAPPLLGSAIVLAAGLIITGALHEDGLADMMDGFGGGKNLEHRLEIMRDSRIGTYGTLALLCACAARLATFEQLQTLDFWACVAIPAAAGAFSRALVVDLLWATMPARTDGMSRLAGRPSRNTALMNVLIGSALVLFAGFTHNPVSGVYALPLALAVTAGVRSMAVRLIGGQTGDVCGSVQVLSEIAVLAAFTSTLR